MKSEVELGETVKFSGYGGPDAHGNSHCGHREVTAINLGLKTRAVVNICPCGFVCRSGGQAPSSWLCIIQFLGSEEKD